MQILEQSFFFVPENCPERFEKVNNTCADGVIIDLEDTVTSEKIIFREVAEKIKRNFDS